MSLQRELLKVEHVSLQQRRLRKPRADDPHKDVNAERVYAAAWKRKNRRLSFLNHGYTLLEWVLCPDGQRWPPPVSRRDAAVAASVIQWLGTAAGLGFIRSCERTIDHARRQRDAQLLASLFRDREGKERPTLEELEREETRPRDRGIML